MFSKDSTKDKIVKALSSLIIAALPIVPSAVLENHQEVNEIDKSAVSSTLAGDGPLIVAAGDIVCHPTYPKGPVNCQDESTAKLVEEYNPRTVLALGDLQYERGVLDDFLNNYDKTWGRFKHKTKPIPGNHEYYTKGAKDYYTYFEKQTDGKKRFYAFNRGSWRIYALNSNCAEFSCANQIKWLKKDLKRNPRKCSLMMTHHPRYGSGNHGDVKYVSRFWKPALKNGVDVALSGHNHSYERFTTMNNDGKHDRKGIRAFVVGTGGKNLKDRIAYRRGSQIFYKERHGVLAIKLNKGSYGWEFKNIDGEIVDSGISRCN